MGQGVSNLATGQGTNKDIDKVIQFFPLGSYLGMSYLGSMIKEDAKLPDKRKTQTQKNDKTQKSKPVQKLGRANAKPANKIQSLINSNQ